MNVKPGYATYRISNIYKMTLFYIEFPAQKKESRNNHPAFSKYVILMVRIMTCIIAYKIIRKKVITDT